ncbi:MAG TPA: hypothetical protein VHO25_08795, partial [Polyangiaceae bacterium]|nr:hypothetical protein [Polyangiaceae bacterium]
NASASFSNSARNCSGPFDDLVDDDGDGEIDPDVEGTCRVEGTTCDFKAECESGACRVAPAGSGSQNEGGGSSGGAANGGSGSEGGASNSPTCRFENDGECDDPTGIGVCPAGTDLADCAASNEGTDGSGDGSDTCPFEDDNECDDPTGTNLCPAGTDLDDCSGESGGESSGSSCSVSDCHNETLCDEFGCLVCSYYCSGDTCVSGGCN